MRDKITVKAKDQPITASVPLPHPPIGIVLAGGQSSRMGKDKALLTFRGKTFLTLAKQALIDAGCVRIIMSGEPRADWNCQHVPDVLANLGPVGGMVSCIETMAVEKTPDTVLIFVAVDTPLLSAQSLTPLLSQTLALTQASFLGKAQVPMGARYEHHPIPLVLRLTTTVSAHAQAIKHQLIAGQSCSIDAFTNPFSLVRLAPDVVQWMQLRNINTPEDWNHLNHEFADQSQ